MELKTWGKRTHTILEIKTRVVGCMYHTCSNISRSMKDMNIMKTRNILWNVYKKTHTNRRSTNTTISSINGFSLEPKKWQSIHQKDGEEEEQSWSHCGVLMVLDEDSVLLSHGLATQFIGGTLPLPQYLDKTSAPSGVFPFIFRVNKNKKNNFKLFSH